MTEIMPVPRNLILLSYQQGAFGGLFLVWIRRVRTIYSLPGKLGIVAKPR